MPPEQRQRLLSGLAGAGVVVLLDQLSKAWLIDLVRAQGGYIELTGFFNLVMAS